ncbi:MAG: helix-turn-helix transcriptional regulator [Acidobacteriota bacterium]
MKSKGRVNDYVAHRLREIRVKRKLNSKEVARRTGIAPDSYSYLEDGWHKISLDNLFRILQALKADVAEVWPRRADVAQDLSMDD